jgi:hypothetical protein
MATLPLADWRDGGEDGVDAGVWGEMSMSAEKPLSFWNRVRVGATTECWPWTAGHNKRGYGRAYLAKKNHAAHRLAWELTNGPITGGLFVLHRCDNPPCCNPSHLFLGTHADNMADRGAKGRAPGGDRHGSRTRPESRACGTGNASAKLTEDDVLAIRGMATVGISDADIATLYAVTKRTINNITAGRLWQHVV